MIVVTQKKKHKCYYYQLPQVPKKVTSVTSVLDDLYQCIYKNKCISLQKKGII